VGDDAYHSNLSKVNLELSPEEMKILKALGPYPVHIDELVQSLSMEPGMVSGILLKLELEGIVEQSPGKLFSLKENH
jgi:DNA processing protein